MEYIFERYGIINVLKVAPSQNRKIGFGMVLQTYHFSIEQVQQVDITKDKNNCLICPLSFSNGGGCYTHKGFMRMGLISMLKRLNKIDIEQYDKDTFDNFVKKVSKVALSLVRFGAYGEPSLLNDYELQTLSKLANHTGYTHNWQNRKVSILLASVHNEKQMKSAKALGYNVFYSADNVKGVKAKHCPASKEAGKVLTCIECGLCNGTKDVKILNH